MKKEAAKEILKKTKKNYELIAESFSKSRKKLWPELFRFKRYVEPGDKILDLGCGNGRLRAFFSDIKVRYVGLDSSEKLIELAQKDEQLQINNQKFIVGDALDMPFEDSEFDVIFSVAVGHHIPSENLRLRFFKEAGRVLNSEGVLIVLVWNLWRKEFLKNHIRSFVLKLSGRTKLDSKDIFYPWKDNQSEVVAERYLHCFTKKELVKLITRAGFVVKEAGFTKAKRNIYAVARPSLNG